MPTERSYFHGAPPEYFWPARIRKGRDAQTAG